MISIPGLQTSTFRDGDLSIHYSIGGDGPPLLLWHGFLGTSFAWHKVVPLLTPHFRVIVPDMRGYGDSSKPESGYDAKTLCEDFRSLLRSLDLNRCAIAAHDMGAAPALYFAANYPDEVSALAYLEEPVLTKPCLEMLHAFSRESWQRSGGLWWWAMAFATDMPTRLIVGKEREFLTWFYETYCFDRSSINDTTVDEYLRTFAGESGVAGAFGVYRALFETMDQLEPLTSASGRVQTPILALGGQRSMGPLVKQMLETVADNVTGGIVEDCGHFIPEEQPRVLAARLIRHFKDLVS